MKNGSTEDVSWQGIEREKAWNRWRRNRRYNLWMNYVNKRNEYVKIRRDELRNYEKDIVNKCKDKLKLFYRYVNGKLKSKGEISKQRDAVVQ